MLKTELFPNPNDGNYVVRLKDNSEKQNVEIIIFGITGKLVAVERGERQNEIKVSSSWIMVST